jgi:hypothetical protein
VAYNYEDESGTVSPGPSIGGSQEMLDTLNPEELQKGYPHTYFMLKHGYCDNPALLAPEALRLARKVTNKAVKHSLIKLAQAASKAKEHLVLTG